jgi:hypothetical protein
MFKTRQEWYIYWRRKLGLKPADPLPKEALPDPLETQEDLDEVFGKEVKPSGTDGKRILDTS